MTHELRADILIVGGGMGGVAAALAAAESGKRVILSEELPWLGGQLTAQAVPFDDHPWAEQRIGSPSYQRLRDGIRDYYRAHYPLIASVRRSVVLNPGEGNINSLGHEPSVAAAVIEQMLAAYISSDRLRVMRGYVASECRTSGDRIDSVTLHNARADHRVDVVAAQYIDATELGDLLPLAGAEHVIGAEGQDDTGELHALAEPDPMDQQAITWAFALDYLEDEDHTIPRPAGYERWRSIRIPSWPGPQFSWTVSDHVTHEPRERRIFAAPTETPWAWDLWHARRALYAAHQEPGFQRSDITIANWPQMDYWARPVLGVSEQEKDLALSEAKELSASFLYWMQTEAPRHDGGTGYPGLRLRPSATGTHDGFAMQAYYRESRRIVSEFRVLEEHIGAEMRGEGGAAASFPDSVGVGAYRIDLHPSTTGRNTVDIDSLPFQIPLGALIPQRIENLLAGGKNIGTTRITNGAFREHPTEWSIGEAAGHTAVHAIDRGVPPRHVRADAGELGELQRRLARTGVTLAWPTYARLVPTSRSGWVDR